MSSFAVVHGAFTHSAQNRFKAFFGKTWLGLALVLSCLLAVPARAETDKLLVGIAPAVPSPYIRQDQPQEMPGFRKKNKVDDTGTLRKAPGKVHIWSEAVKYLGAKSGLPLEVDLPQSQLVFERKLAHGLYDFAYITPLQFVSFRDFPGYTAIAKRKAEPLRSVVLVKKFSEFKTFAELRDLNIGFSHPLDYTGSIIPRDSLQRANFPVQGSFFPGPKDVLRAVLDGRVDAGAVGSEIWDAAGPEITHNMRVIWDSPGYTPFAMVAHPRLPFHSTIKMQRALVGMIKHDDGAALLDFMQVRNGFESATDGDWHDAKNIDLTRLNQSADSPSLPATPKQNDVANTKK